MNDVPEAVRMPEGGTIPSDPVYCDRCDDLATLSYEGRGVDFLSLCDGCYRDLGEWLNATDGDADE